MIKYYVKVKGQIVGHFTDYEKARDYAEWLYSTDTVYVESEQHGVEFMTW